MSANDESKEVKQRLLEYGRAEFIEKGFEKASLRKICGEAGVTTGALYFFFDNKDDLFCSIFGGLRGRIEAIVDSHFAMKKQLADEGNLLEDDFSDEFEMVDKIIDELYFCRDDVLTLLSGAEGSSLENVKDALIAKIDKHNHLIAEGFCRELNIPNLSDYLIHWMSHSQLDMFVFMIEHIEDKEAAREYLKGAMAFELAGWQAAFGINPK